MNSLSELLEALKKDSKAPLEYYCEDCLTVVPHRRMRCPACKAKQIEADRRLVLQPAIQSLPEMPWAKWGSGLAKSCAKPIFEAVRAWDRTQGSLVLLGPSGCGKTSTVVARVRGMLDMAASGKVDRAGFQFVTGIRFITAADIARDRKNWPLGGGESPLVEEAIEATLLILDELGFEAQTDTAIPEVVDVRYRNKRPTITTSGLQKARLTERYGEATSRKLAGGVGAIVEAFDA